MKILLKFNHKPLHSGFFHVLNYQFFHRKIDKIYYNEHSQLSYSTNIGSAPKTFVFNDDTQKYSEPLLISEDGVEIFKGDYTCLVNKKFFTVGIYSPQQEVPVNPDYLVFAKGNNASDWIGENCPRYSRKDMLSAIGYSRGYTENVATVDCFNHWLNSPYNIKK